MKVFRLFYLLLFSALSMVLTAREVAKDSIPNVFKNYGNLMKSGHLTEAVKCLSGLLKPNVQLTGKEKLAVYNNLGILHKKLGQNDIALKYYDGAELVYLNNNFADVSLLVSIYINKLNIYALKEEYNKALEYNEKGIRSVQGSNASQAFKQQSISSLYLSAGNIYSQLEEYPQALESYKKSLSIRIKYNLAGKFKVYVFYARTYAKMGDQLLADQYFNLSIKASEAENKGYSIDLLYIYIEYSNFLLSVTENDKALAVSKKLLKISLESFGERNHLTSICYQLLGNIYRKNKDYQNALAYYQKALIAGSKVFNDLKIEANPLLTDVNFNLWQLRLLQRKADALAMMADKEKESKTKIVDLLVSLSTTNLAIEMTRMIRTDYQDEETRLIFNEKQKNVFVMALETALKLYVLNGDKKYLNLAFQAAQQGKANELKYEIARNELFSNNEIPDSLRNKENELQADINGYATLIRKEQAFPSPDTTKIAYWKDQLFDLNRLLEKQVEETEKKYPRFIDKIKRGAIVAIEAIQSGLGPDESLIEYVISERDETGNRRLYAFVITQKNMVCHTELVDSTLSENFSLLRNQLANQFTNSNSIENYNRMNQLLFDAYKVLVWPIEKYFAGKQLIIIPDDELSYFPFDAFLTSWSKKKRMNYAELAYLIRDYSISYGYSISTLRIGRSNPEYNPKVIGFAPDYSNLKMIDGNRFKELKNSSIEVEGILNNFDGEVFKSDQATSANFRSKLKSGAILHLAMHTELDTNQAGLSSLIFAPDIVNKGKYQLYNYEIGQMSINSPMVVLSACNTGDGKLYNGEGIMSLARNFVLAGVPSVVETLWPVEDIASSKIMGSFYKYLSKGMPKNTALRQAKLDYIKTTSPSFVNPRLWAAFTLMGDLSAVKRVWWQEPKIIIGLSILIISIVVLLIYLSRFFKIC